MQGKFYNYDIITLILCVINDSKKFCDKTYVYNEVKKYFNSNPDDFSLCVFLFEWERLKTMGNLIISKTINNIEYFGVGTIGKITEFVQTDFTIDFTINIKDTIETLCLNPNIYSKSAYLASFLKNTFPNYSSIYNLLNDNKNEIGFDNINKFIDIYSELFDTDDIIKLIVAKRLFKLEKNKPNSQTLFKKNNTRFNLTFGIGLSFGFVGIASMVLYKNTNWFNYLSSFLNPSNLNIQLK